jgi:hypothetical protein
MSGAVFRKLMAEMRSGGINLILASSSQQSALSIQPRRFTAKGAKIAKELENSFVSSINPRVDHTHKWRSLAAFVSFAVQSLWLNAEC